MEQTPQENIFTYEKKLPKIKIGFTKKSEDTSQQQTNINQQPFFKKGNKWAPG